MSNSGKSSRSAYWCQKRSNFFAYCSLIYIVCTSTKNMKLILPSIYSVGKLQSCKLIQNEIYALQKLTTVTNDVLSFNKLYSKKQCYSELVTEGPMTCSICSYLEKGEKQYETILKFLFSPATVLLKPFKKTSTSLISSIGKPCRPCFQSYADADMLSTFIVQVFSDPLPLLAVSIHLLCSRCVKISFPDSNYCYIVNIPNNFEQH